MGSKNNAGLKTGDLESLNGQNQDRTPDNDLRSIKSEYDYGSKKKFVDVLGNIKKTNSNGLKGLENHPGAKNMETASRRSNASMTSSYRRKFNGLMNSKPGQDGNLEPINDQEIEIMDKDGNKIMLSIE